MRMFATDPFRETTERKAQQILGKELDRRGWTPDRLVRLRKADPEKLKIAQRLRAETTVTLTRLSLLERDFDFF